MKISVYIATSVDGFIARPNGDVEWLQDMAEPTSDDPHQDYGYSEFTSSIDVMVMGRKSFEKVLTFGQWPYDKPVYVLSSSVVDIPETLTSTVFASNAAPQQLLEQLTQKGFQHVYIDGGQTIQGFLSQGLVDQLIISRVPRLIGEGVPLFGQLMQDVMLQHQETQVYSNGLIQIGRAHV